MEILRALLISSVAGLSTMIGGVVVFFRFKEENINKFISFCLAFSLAVMISISVLDLIPESFFKCLYTYGFSKTIVILCIAFVLSYIIITILSKLIKKADNNGDLYTLGILNMIVLILHNLPEGVATFLSSYQELNLGIKLGIAITLHNIPEGISIAVPIYYATNSKLKALKATFISGIAEPLGAVLAFIFLKNYVSELMISVVLILVASLMITLSIQEILPKAMKYNEKSLLKIGIIIGILIVIINVLLF